MKKTAEQKNRIDADKMFKNLVESALDFLKTATQDIKNNAPKYSIIHFYAAIELILKARLMREHWTLLVTGRNFPDQDRFVVGDFQSVHLNEANERLGKVVPAGLSKTEFEAFKSLAAHRNKIIHFFHANTARSVKEILRAWYFLHGILTSKWETEFCKWSNDISDIDSDMRKLRTYLDVVFEEVSPKIAEKQRGGLIFVECHACGFMAKEHENSMKEAYESKCLVCNFVEHNVNVQCDKCGEMVIFRECGEGRCLSCKKDFDLGWDLGYLKDALVSSQAHTKDGLVENFWGNCSDCGVSDALVRTDSDQWVCTNCLQVFEPEMLSTCGWCLVPCTGDVGEISSYTGCDFCNGSNQYQKDME